MEKDNKLPEDYEVLDISCCGICDHCDDDPYNPSGPYCDLHGAYVEANGFCKKFQ